MPKLGGVAELLAKKIIKKGEKLPVSHLERVLKDLSWNEERRALMEKALPFLKGLRDEPNLEKAFLTGSFKDIKYSPEDVDVLLKFRGETPETELGAWGWGGEKLKEKTGVHLLPYTPKHKGSLDRDFLEEMVRESKARYGRSSFKRIIGLGATTGAGLAAVGILGEDEAEALPIGKLVKGGVKMAEKVAGKEVSSASASLVGKVVKGKVIKAITKGAQDWRYLVFEDGSFLPVTKDVVTDLARGFGTEGKMKTFENLAPDDQLTQAFKSLQYHLSRQPKYNIGPRSPRYIREWHEDYLKNMRELAPEAEVDTVFVEYFDPKTKRQEYFQMPRPYAEVLERIGVVKIRKGRAEKKVLKK